MGGHYNQSTITDVLTTLYPPRTLPPGSSEALFGFGPAQAMDLLKQFEIFPSVGPMARLGVEEKRQGVDAARLANIVSQMRLPQEQAAVNAFLQMPTSAQFLGPQHFTPERQLSLERPEYLDTLLNQAIANVLQTKATTGRTEAETGKIGAETGLFGAETEKIRKEMIPGHVLDLALARLGVTPAQRQVKDIAMPMVEAALKAGDPRKAAEIMAVVSGQGALAAEAKGATGIEAAKERAKGLISVKNNKDGSKTFVNKELGGKEYRGDPEYVFPRMAADLAQKEFQSNPSKYRKGLPPHISDGAIIRSMTKQLLKQMAEDIASFKGQLGQGQAPAGQ